eukprot:CAMPEP_0197540744 /NCGR_PEP_ID=MMETSP1318-20131121/66770_1 /TAXON_ID=552666 /ORGANISM="Partenskyella glossopodia, Strain RCC365" /LENGTH=395 /DNA_ID=CAMNT_0043099833 /DNA_START=146 /DNA_END=1333 /DNA_ORIENTATION=-
MTRITVDLIRKKAEHNEGILESLEELSLHQLNLEKIEVIGSCCKRLKILYLQNNLIPKIENLRRLKDVEYLNLALNNIKLIQGLESCESLKKLDLTVNFIPIENLAVSIENLTKNSRLDSLFLSGNPCCEFKGYREFVVGSLPFLNKLDGKKITKSERILARQQLSEIRAALAPMGLDVKGEAEKDGGRERAGDAAAGADDDDDDDDDDDNDIPTLEQREEKEGDEEEAFTAENRLKWFKEEEEEERKKQEERQKAIEDRKPKDPLKEARKKMSMKVVPEDVPEGKLPKQRNMARVKFAFSEDSLGNLICTIDAPKYLDTSLIEVDIHPKWFQCVIKDKNLLLHTPEEVHPDKSRIKRLLHNGQLLLIMPIQNWNKHTSKGRLNESRENTKQDDV